MRFDSLRTSLSLLACVVVGFGQRSTCGPDVTPCSTLADRQQLGCPDAPELATCPSGSLITRTGSPLSGAQTLASREATYIDNRRTSVLTALWTTYLENSALGTTGYDIAEVVSHLPRVSIAVSGGGYRAALYGAATISALDLRNATRVAPLLQLSDYISGLSGGSWFVSSLALNNMPDMYSLVLGGDGSDGWKMDLGLLTPGGILDSYDYVQNILADVQEKASALFPVSLIDVWGRIVSYHFYNGTSRSNYYDDVAHDRGRLWSSITSTLKFQTHSMPLPIAVSTSRVNEDDQSLDVLDNLISLNNTQFEFTPFTFGSFDHTLGAHVPVEHAGTWLNNGSPANSSACAVGYDNAGFVAGTSAALFNVLDSIDEDVDLLLDPLKFIFDRVTAPVSSSVLVSNWPNSFKNFSPESSTTFESSANDILQLTDGGENGENIPLGPLLVKARAQDLIFAVDGSSDTASISIITEGWPNGASLIATADRVANHSGGFTSFPPVPATTAEFISQGLTERPVFFGCDTTGNGDTSVVGNYPIIVYLANYGSTDATEEATDDFDYTTQDQLAFLDAGHANARKGYPSGSATIDSNWPLALKCATVDRARKRAGLSRSTACAAQFARYCWADGVTESAPATRVKARSYAYPPPPQKQ